MSSSKYCRRARAASAFESGARAAFLEQHRSRYDGLIGALKALETEIAALPSKPEELVVIARRAAELRSETAFLFESNEKNYVYWFERRGKGVFVAATPIDVSAILRERLFDAFDTIVLTSATLAVSGRFDFLKQRLGMQVAQETVLPHEFDYAQPGAALHSRRAAGRPQSRVCAESSGGDFAATEVDGGTGILPVHQLRPDESDFRTGALLRAISRCFCRARRLAWRLLERFRTTPGAVLFATSSFWQGVDVPGEQLSCVIIDRLPFAVPTDPVVAARVRTLTEDGRNAFAEYQVPEAVLALKQGFGRLIRTRTDRGVLAILDNRIQRMQYGKIFLESLPEYSLTRDIADVQRFMKAPELERRFPAGPADQPKTMFQVSVEETFSAGHALRGYKGKCENPHGHNYRVRVNVEGEQLDSIGLLFDFSHLKRILRDLIGDVDHKFLNDQAAVRRHQSVGRKYRQVFLRRDRPGRCARCANAPRINSITVWETDETSATYIP